MVNSAGGIFDKSPKIQPQQTRTENKPANVVEMPRKQDFRSPEQLAADSIRRSQMTSKSASNTAEALAEAKQQEAIDHINSSIGSNSVEENEKKIEEISKVSEEDIKMAESMIFNGYAEMTEKIPNFPSHTITVCTTSPEEIDFVDEMIFEMISASEDKETGKANLSDSIVRSTRNMYNLSLSYKGMDGNDLHQDKTCQLALIKKAIESLYKFEIAGDIKGMASMKEDIKKSIKKRSYMIRRTPTPVIDFISQTKYKFDQKMFSVMSEKGLVSL